MKRTKIFSIFIFIFFWALNSLANCAGQTTGITQLRNQSGSEVSFYYINELRHLISIIIPAGKNAELVIETPIVFYYSIGTSKLPFYIKPADTLNISIDKNGDPVLVCGDSIRNNELKLMRDMKIRFNSTRTVADIKKLGQLKQSRTLYEAHLMEEYRKKSQFFSTYVKTYSTGKEFQKYVKNYLYYQMISEKIAVLPLKGEPIDSVVEYKKSLNCDECLNIDSYTSLAQHYVFLTYNAFSEKAYEEINEQFSGKTREFMLMSLMQLYNKNSLPFFETRYNKFVSETQYGPYRNRIAELKQVEMLNRDFTNSGLLLSLKGDTIRFETLLNSLGDKHVYIDFWASWCIPCIDAIPASKLFEDTSKTVAVVYLSLDKDPSAWKEYTKTLGLDKRESYLVLGNFKSTLARKYKISAIPHYVLISKDRKTVIPSAPDAKDQKLLRLINTLK